MSSSKSIKKNFGYNLIYNIVNIIVPLLTAPYTSRVLGAANIGIYSYTYSLISTVVMIGALGAATYAQKEIAATGDDVAERSYIFWEVFWSKAVVTILASVLFFIYAIRDRYFYYYILQLPFLFAAVLDISWLFQGVEKFDYIAIRNIIVRIVGIILLFILVKDTGDLPIYLLIIGVTQFLGNLTMWTYVKQFIVLSPIRNNMIVMHLKNMMVYFIPSITYQIYAVLDKAMLGWLVGSNYENGYYEQGHKIVNMIVNVISAYTIVMRSRMSFLFKNNDVEEIKRKMIDSSNVIAFMVFPMSFGLAIITSTMVPWFFGEGYERVNTILYVFCPVFVFMGYSRLIGTHLLTPSGRQGKSNIAQIIACVFNIILNAILIPRFESVGAAIASVCAEFIIVVIYYWMVRNEFSIVTVASTGWKKLLAGLTMFCVLFPFEGKFSKTIPSTCMQVLLGTIVYVFVLVLLQDAFSVNLLKKSAASLKNKIVR